MNMNINLNNLTPYSPNKFSEHYYTSFDIYKTYAFKLDLEKTLIDHEHLFSLVGYPYHEKAPMFFPSERHDYLQNYYAYINNVRLQVLLASFSEVNETSKGIPFEETLYPYQQRFYDFHFKFITKKVFFENPLLMKIIAGKYSQLELLQASLIDVRNFNEVFDSAFIFPKTSEKSTMLSCVLEPSSNLALTEQEFLLCSIAALLFGILGGLVVLRDRLMKLLILIEILILLMILGFTVLHGAIFYTLGNLPMAFILIALAACEAVLGLSIIITRTRILANYLTVTSNSFIKYLKKTAN